MSGTRVLIIKTSSMGDIVHALPLVSDLVRYRPGTRVEWVVEEGFTAVARLHSAVTRVIPVAQRRWRRRLLWPSTWAEMRNVRQQMHGVPYDHVIDCQGLLKSAWLTRWAVGPRTGPDATSAREPIAARFYDQKVAVPRELHAIERNRRFGAAALGYTLEGPPRFSLRVPRLPPGLVPADRPYAVLLTNASRPTKLWPDEHWSRLEAWLAGEGMRSVLPWGSPAEKTTTQRRQRSMRDAFVLPRVSLDVAASVLAGARVVIGLDTGLSHLAAAVGRPTVGLFCDYDPALVGLMGDGPCVSLGGVAMHPPVDAVIEAAQQVMAGAPAPAGSVL